MSLGLKCSEVGSNCLRRTLPPDKVGRTFDVRLAVKLFSLIRQQGVLNALERTPVARKVARRVYAERDRLRLVAHGAAVVLNVEIVESTTTVSAGRFQMENLDALDVVRGCRYSDGPALVVASRLSRRASIAERHGIASIRPRIARLAIYHHIRAAVPLFL